MTGKIKVEVRIGGKDYTLVGVESEDYIQRVSHYIDKKMNEISRVNNKLSTAMVAVLTAINVADDFFKAHENEGHLKKELKHTQDELERLRTEHKRFSEENSFLANKNSGLQLALAKREAELSEVRNTLDKVGR